MGMISDFFAPVMVAWQLDDFNVMFGQTIVTTRRAALASAATRVLENRPADDVYAGRLVAEQGYEVKLLALHRANRGRFQVDERLAPQAHCAG